ncbi:STAS domain-containing protein [Kitasatospora arboriphila]
MTTLHLPPPAPTRRGTTRTLRITSTDVASTALILHLAGEIDQDQRTALEDALGTAVEARPPRLIVDLSGLAFCDSTGLNALLKTRLAAQAADVELVIAAPPAHVERLLKITGTDHLFTARRSVRAALYGPDRPSPPAGKRAAMSSELKTSTRRIGPAVVCVFAGDLHQGTADEAQRTLDTALGDLPTVLAVDLSGVDLLASGGLNTLLRARIAAADLAVPTVLVAPTAAVRRVLEITDTVGLFPVYATAGQAARHREEPPASGA